MLLIIHYGLLVALAMALVVAAFTDIRWRLINNWLTGAVALLAPAFWWSSGLALWPDVALQLAVAFVTLVVFAGLFALRWMGGGDVKLLTALALWVPWDIFLDLLMVMALVGGVLTIALGFWHIACRRKDRLAIPYGVAIAAGGLWVLAADLWPQTALTLAAA